MSMSTPAFSRAAREILLLSAVSLAALSASGEARKPPEILQAIKSQTLDLGAAVPVEALKLNTGMADLHLKSGVLYPIRGGGLPTVEMIFLGEGRLTLEPPDAVEAGQLALFTDQEELDETFSAGVFVVARDEAAAALLKKPTRESSDTETDRRAQDLYERWSTSPERRLLDVEGTLLGNALEDPYAEGYFAGWLQGEDLGEFLYVVEPSAREQVTLGKFVRLDASEKEKRKIRKSLHKEQRQGRFIGVDVEDLGEWNTWISASQRSASGDVRRGLGAFEPTHYELDVTLGKKDLDIAATARLSLRATVGGCQIPRLTLNSDLKVQAVRDEAGQKLFFYQSGHDVMAVLPSAPAAGEVTVVEIDYGGHVVERFEGKTFYLRDTQSWYPHAGAIDLATYDAVFHWPANLDLVASGKLLESGPEAGGMQWQRRKLSLRTAFFSFEVGRFRTLTRQAGHVEISFSLDREAKSLLKEEQEVLLETLASALTYFEEIFGPYPLDHLTAVTTPRLYSQSLLGFVSLSSFMMLDAGGLMAALFGSEDRRTVIAHEVAHQWWGHIVSMESYRDEWISEAMANYAAINFARKKLWPERPSLVGPTTGWQNELLRTTADGRTLESLGPLTVGQRLASSHSADAHSAIIYKKGAVVVDMLSRIFGEERFLEVLRAAAKHIDHRAVSTEVFLEILERLSGSDLTPFANQFIYGTGLPEIYFTYEIAPSEEGWTIQLQATQQAPYRFTYRVVERSDGKGLDVEREAEMGLEVEASSLPVPIRIVAFDPAKATKGHRGKKSKDPHDGLVRFKTQRLLQGSTTQLSLDLKLEPREVVLDPDREVFGRFFNERKDPKRTLFYRGLDRGAEGNSQEAARLFQEALGARVASDLPSQEGTSKKNLEEERETLDARIHIHLARHHLDAGRLPQGRRELTAAKDLLGRSSARWLLNQHRALEGRAALLEGDAEEAFKLLRKAATYGRNKMAGGTETTLLLAIAAHKTRRLEIFETARKRALARGADVSALPGEGG